MIIDYHIGDEIVMKKPHPCGSYRWTVVRGGGDIGVTCVSCNRRLTLPRTQLQRRMRGKPIRASKI